MQFIQGQHRQQTYFVSLEDQVAADNPVRLIDAFIDKLDLQQLGFPKNSASQRRPAALCATGFFKTLPVWLFKQSTQQPQAGTGVQPQC